MLAVGILSLSLFSCGDASGGNKNILPKDPNSAEQTQQSSTTQVADTIKKEGPAQQPAGNAAPAKTDSTKVSSGTK